MTTKTCWCGNAFGKCPIPHTSPVSEVIAEAAQKLSDTIWNQSGKHSHNELDEIIATTLNRVASVAREEVMDEARPEIMQKFEECFMDGTRAMKESILAALPKSYLFTDAWHRGFNEGLKSIRSLITNIK